MTVPGFGFFYFDGSTWQVFTTTMTPDKTGIALWGIDQDALNLVAPFAGLLPANTALYTGYGTSLDEMVANSRYHLLATNQCSGGKCQFK